MGWWSKIRKKVVGTAAGVVGGIFGGPAGAAAATSAAGALMSGGGGGGGGGGRTAAPADPPAATVNMPDESGETSTKGGGMQGMLNWVKSNPIILAVVVVGGFIAFKMFGGKKRGGR